MVPLLLACAWSGGAAATAVYSYEGNLYNSLGGATLFLFDPAAGGLVRVEEFDASMRVSGSFTVPAPLLGFDGTIRLVDPVEVAGPGLGATLVGLELAASGVRDASGAIVDWRIELDDRAAATRAGDSFALISTSRGGPLSAVDSGIVSHCTDPGCTTAFSAEARTFFDPGTWTLTIVPEPASALLLATGCLLGLLFGWKGSPRRALA